MFSSAADRQCTAAFIRRRIRQGYCTSDQSCLSNIVDTLETDEAQQHFLGWNVLHRKLCEAKIKVKYLSFNVKAKDII